MPAGIPQSQDELKEHLREHLHFLEKSSNEYDHGDDAEAKRLATSLRVLLHNTDRSKALLDQLGMKSMRFCDTAGRIDRASVMSYMGLISLSLTTAGPQYLPLLDEDPDSSAPRVPFSQWWNATVFIDDRKKRLTRKQLVLGIANQDGGTHVDPVLEETYARLTRDTSLGWTYNENGHREPIKNPAFAAVRQISHEVLKTLVPGYVKVAPINIRDYKNFILTKSKAKDPAQSQGVSRNALCPCGSGKIFKYCHGKMNN